MIASRKDAIYLIGIHLVPNIVGIARFSYGFHRTGSRTEGLIFDVSLGIECALNIFSDTVVILLLREAEKSKGVSMDAGAVSAILRAFVVWNTVAMLFCCGANLAGLRYPPKWFTGQDADEITFRDQMKLVLAWGPWIIMAGYVKLYYTTRLYAFYKVYAATGGKAFDTVAAVHRAPGHETPDCGPAPTGPQQRHLPQPQIDPAIIYRDPTPIIGRTPASGLSPVAPSPMHPDIRKQLPAYTISTVPPSFNQPTQGKRLYAYPSPQGPATASPVPAGPGFPTTQQHPTSGGPTHEASTHVAQATPRGSTSSGPTASKASRSSGAQAPLTPAAASGAVFPASATPSGWTSSAGPLTPQPYPAEYRAAVRAEASAQELPASRVMRARRPVPPPEGTRRSKKRH